MASHLQLTIVMIALVTSVCISRSNADSAMDPSSTDFPFLDSPSVLSPSTSIVTAPPPSHLQTQELQSPMSVLESILSNLGFQEFAVAVPSLTESAYYTWNGPSTVFAPTDDSIRSCSGQCSVPQLLREHIVPGIFTFDYLKKLSFGTKLETMSTGKCITVTSATSRVGNSTIVYIGGVEITRPDFFNNGLVVVHRLEGFISPLSPFSCNIERLNSVTFPPPQSENRTITQTINPPTTSAIMRLMLKDAMLRLHNNGFSVLSLALRVKYPEIVSLHNMTVFALDDSSIFSGGHAYLSNFRFHIVPNRMLMNADLMRLQTGSALPTLEHGESLMVTTAGSGGAQMRINYVRIKTADVVYNLKIAVHSIFLPFPHLHPAAVEFGRMGGTGGTVFDAAGAMTGGTGGTVSDTAAAMTGETGGATAMTGGTGGTVSDAAAAMTGETGDATAMTGGTGGTVSDTAAAMIGESGGATAMTGGTLSDISAAMTGETGGATAAAETGVFPGTVASDPARNMAGTTTSCADSENGCGAPPAMKHEDTL